MRRRDVLKLAAGGLAGMAAGTLPAFANRLFPADGETAFQMLQDGRSVGAHRITFRRAAGAFLVRSESRFALGDGYRFAQQVEETWRDGWLAEVASDTDDAGAHWRLRAERDVGGVFSGRANAFPFTVSGYLVPSSLWHRDTPNQEALFDVRDGHVKLIRSALIGEEPVEIAGEAVTARRYRLWGQLRRDLWYGEDRGLVRAALPARDGRMLELVLS